MQYVPFLIPITGPSQSPTLLPSEQERGQREREKERESQADSMLSAQPDMGLNPTTPDHNPSWNQESDTQLTEPPRCPRTPWSWPEPKADT